MSRSVVAAAEKVEAASEAAFAKSDGAEEQPEAARDAAVRAAAATAASARSLVASFVWRRPPDGSLTVPDYTLMPRAPRRGIVARASSPLADENARSAGDALSPSSRVVRFPGASYLRALRQLLPGAIPPPQRWRR